MTEGSFFCQEKGESRYEETIPDRPTTRGATVPPVGPRREPQHPDDLSHGRGGGTSARRSRPPAARGRIGVDELGHGGNSTPSGALIAGEKKDGVVATAADLFQEAS